MPVQELLLPTCELPKLSLLNVEPQHLELLAALAIEDLLPKQSREPGQQPTKLQRLMPHSLLPRSLNRLQLLLDQEDLLLLLPQLPMPHWKKASLSISFPLHLLQMGNALLCPWEEARGG